MVYVMIILAILTRFIPHVHNFSPVYGALLFGGAHLRKRDSIWFSSFTVGSKRHRAYKFHLSHEYRLGGAGPDGGLRVDRHDRVDPAEAVHGLALRSCLFLSHQVRFI